MGETRPTGEERQPGRQESPATSAKGASVPAPGDGFDWKSLLYAAGGLVLGTGVLDLLRHIHIHITFYFS
ncbi:hypothetical protein AB0M29_42385 [Streptomyces sp. NPDC051976]|uniref:hypothetical protein n=1 Tax=Streptomyces sp. NPDC051976 TaxID=3154947 RepID=UPI00341ECDF4